MAEIKKLGRYEVKGVLGKGAVGVDLYELLAQAENEVRGRYRRIDLTLCSHPVDGRSLQ